MADANVITVTEANFDQEVLNSASPVLVDFWGEGCGPCRMIAPVLDELAHEYASRVKFAKVNVGEDGTLAAQYRISAVPTLLIIKNGQVMEQMVGAKSKRDFKNSLDRAAA